MSSGRGEAGQQGDYKALGNRTEGQGTGEKEKAEDSQQRQVSCFSIMPETRTGLILLNPLNMVHLTLKNPSTQEPCGI